MEDGQEAPVVSPARRTARLRPYASSAAAKHTGRHRHEGDVVRRGVVRPLVTPARVAKV